MTALDWQRDKARRQRQELRAEARCKEARQHEQRIRHKQQKQLLTYARQNTDHPFLSGVAKQERLSRNQARIVREIAHERGQKIAPAAGGSSKNSRRRHRRRDEERRDPAVNAQLQQARRIVEDYSGSDGWILHLRREFSSVDERWLPTDKQARAIFEKVGVESTS